MTKNNKNRAGSEVQYGPRPAGEVLHDFSKNSNDPQAAAYPGRFYPNTELAVDLKLLTHQPGRMPEGAYFNGVLRRDGEQHFTFIQTLPPTAGKRNPHVYEGRYITVTRREDGSLRLNFRNLETGKGFRVERYALGVCNELCMALGGLIEE